MEHGDGDAERVSAEREVPNRAIQNSRAKIFGSGDSKRSSSPFSGWGFFGALKVPIYVNAVGAQLSYPFVLQLGAATAFSL